MIKKYIKKIITEMIMRDELKFELSKGEQLINTPNKKFMKKYNTILLTVRDKNNNPISITETKLEDIVFDKGDVQGSEWDIKYNVK